MRWVLMVTQFAAPELPGGQSQNSSAGASEAEEARHRRQDARTAWAAHTLRAHHERVGHDLAAWAPKARVPGRWHQRSAATHAVHNLPWRRPGRRLHVELVCVVVVKLLHELLIGVARRRLPLYAPSLLLQQRESLRLVRIAGGRR